MQIYFLTVMRKEVLFVWYVVFEMCKLIICDRISFIHDYIYIYSNLIYFYCIYFVILLYFGPESLMTKNTNTLCSKIQVFLKWPWSNIHMFVTKKQWNKELIMLTYFDKKRVCDHYPIQRHWKFVKGPVQAVVLCCVNKQFKSLTN